MQKSHNFSSRGSECVLNCRKKAKAENEPTCLIGVIAKPSLEVGRKFRICLPRVYMISHSEREKMMKRDAYARIGSRQKSVPLVAKFFAIDFLLRFAKRFYNQHRKLGCVLEINLDKQCDSGTDFCRNPINNTKKRKPNEPNLFEHVFIIDLF